jgi:transcriptional regulator with XRE-family HTH domain
MRVNMNKDLLEHSFSHTLKGVLSDYGITNYKLAKRSGLDPGHVSRLVSGKRNRPRSETVQKLAVTLARLGVSDADISRIQISAGFKPFDGVADTPLVETPRRPDRRRRETKKNVDPSKIILNMGPGISIQDVSKKTKRREFIHARIDMDDGDRPYTAIL